MTRSRITDTVTTVTYAFSDEEKSSMNTPSTIINDEDLNASEVSGAVQSDTDDVLGIIARDNQEICVWWSVSVSSLTEVDPSIRFNDLCVNVYTETRSGIKKRFSTQVDRLHGHLVVSKLPSGGRVSAAVGVRTQSGFTHIVGSTPIRLPSKTIGKDKTGRAFWSGSEQRGQSKRKGSLSTENIGMDGRILAHVEHLPWERPR